MVGNSMLNDQMDIKKAKFRGTKKWQQHHQNESNRMERGRGADTHIAID